MRELGSILSDWHEWRAAYSLERKFARVAAPADDEDEDERLRRMMIATVEEEIARLPRDLQLALQHAARCEWLGNSAIKNPRLPTGDALAELTDRAKHRLYRRLLILGLI